MCLQLSLTKLWRTSSRQAPHSLPGGHRGSPPSRQGSLSWASHKSILDSALRKRMRRSLPWKRWWPPTTQLRRPPRSEAGSQSISICQARPSLKILLCDSSTLLQLLWLCFTSLITLWQLITTLTSLYIHKMSDAIFNIITLIFISINISITTNSKGKIWSPSAPEVKCGKQGVSWRRLPATRICNRLLDRMPGGGGDPYTVLKCKSHAKSFYAFQAI